MNIRKITVIGAGTMGHGIAQVAAQAGYTVALWDMQTDALAKARAKVTENLDGAVTRGKLSADKRDEALSRLTFDADRSSAIADTQLVIEAIAENLAVKQQVFADLQNALGQGVILASNTSSLPLSKISAELKWPEQVVGMHFFNPVHLMALVEIVVHDKTSQQVRDTAVAVTKQLGKEPIVVKDSPGFASSRLGVVLGLEAMRMLEQGVASAEDIDKAMELGYRHPMGPLKLTDVVGLDIRLAIAETLYRELQGDQYRPPEILRQKVAEGKLGKKSGEGFYKWP